MMIERSAAVVRRARASPAVGAGRAAMEVRPRSE